LFFELELRAFARQTTWREDSDLRAECPIRWHPFLAWWGLVGVEVERHGFVTFYLRPKQREPSRSP
jgi:hypothetical protein